MSNLCEKVDRVDDLDQSRRLEDKSTGTQGKRRSRPEEKLDCAIEDVAGSHMGPAACNDRRAPETAESMEIGPEAS
jgi:hypothetical protein